MPSLRCLNAPSGARLFVQLASTDKRPISLPTNPTTSLPPILDILVPRWTSHSPSPQTRGRAQFSTAAATDSDATSSTRSVSRALPSVIAHPRQLVQRTPWSSGYQPRTRKSLTASQRRTFASAAPLGHTRCVYNPQEDEDGKAMSMGITDRAGKRLSQIMAKDANPNLALRIQVESGGCHGFQYLMSLITLPDPDSPDWSSVVREDDSIFQYAPDAEPQPAPTTPTRGAPKIILDQPSLELLKDSKVDFTMELIGSQFKITDNPHATSACGCGTSFDIKL
ncbi:hypothetical protein SODALDRAFT_350692 [Sodiomyces alkalinus F11]|uniref:Core domain-containing protein n=1 Tax=Sodiomyces alkalinus (strain CBS 110278 / VKM F-3762 / F11) TaxID=1314773 RepID=A0A3N2PVU0_SODAK|nr:hypothetical protein SODALDRAFT_350692 [Sodiomyces alkalinus F11]ROT38466.1 hypothetical protein SODALDRAFT_350692 [Sodiomyces alkalinus F11]